MVVAISAYPDFMQGRAEYRFSLLNLTLNAEFSCGPFTITPLEDNEGLMDRDGPRGDDNVRSGRGKYDIDGTAPDNGAYNAWANQAYDEFARRAEVIDLLLSFAQRRHVQIFEPHIYVQKNGEWQFRGGGRLYPVYRGSFRGLPWYLREADLIAFMQHSYRRMTDELDEVQGGEQSLGLRLALRLLDAARMTEMEALEVQYLKLWMAFEILVNAATSGGRIVDTTSFSTVKKEVQAAIRPILKKHGLTKDQRDAIYTKLGELNRRSAGERAHLFLMDKFAPYPIQQVRESDVARWVDIRNAITHRGIMQIHDPDSEYGRTRDYAQTLGHEYFRLKSVLERVIWALLDWPARPLLELPWQSYRLGGR